MDTPQLHKTQLSVLHALRYAESKRFSELMSPTGHTSDTFKFHLRKLIKSGYIEKTAEGSYCLTLRGKEYANNLNEDARTTEKQPKVSALAIVTKIDNNGQTQYLVQQRLRQPFYGYWSEIHGRVAWGEPFEETARRQLKRQTGLDAVFTVQGFRRVRDHDAETSGLLEDKLFVVLRAINVTGELTNEYAGGTNAWLTAEELYAQEKVFTSTRAIIESIEAGNNTFAAHDFTYQSEEY
jgi:ADP-ribose pyrophosphatase YjhB (NUDIX family)/predicted transcriptional regulator